MSGLGEFGALADLAGVRNALGKIKTWSRTISAGTIPWKDTTRFPYRNLQEAIEAEAVLCTLVDGVTAPTAVVGTAQIFVDIADGNLKVIFGDGFVTTLANDS